MADWFAENKPKVIADKVDWFGANKAGAGETDEHGNRIVRNPDGSVKFMQGPGFSGNADTSPDRNVATVGSVGVAPEDILTVPSLVSGAKALTSGARNLVGKIGMPSPETLRRGAEIVGSPWKEGTKAVLNKGAEILERRAAPAAVEAAAPVVEKATAINPSKTLDAAREAFKSADVEPLRGEVSNTHALLMRGKSPEEALKVVLGNRPAAAKVAEVVAADVPKLTAAEVKAGLDMVARGKTPKEAMDAILLQRELMQRMGPGSLTDDAVRARLDFRNNSGQIKTPSAQTAELRRMP